MQIDDDLTQLATTTHLLVTAVELERVGMTKRQWRYRCDAGEWLPAAPGVWRHRMTPLDWQLQARAGVGALGRQSALYGRTAAAWWALGDIVVHEVEFVVPRTRRSRTFPFVLHTTQQWTPADLIVHDGVRVTTASRTIVDLADGSTSARELEVVIDHAVSRRLTSFPTLHRRIGDLVGSGRVGSPMLRALLLDSGGESYLERRFLRLVRRAGLPRPTCQVVHRADGKRIARVDFQFPGTNVIVEVSGRLGHVTDRDRQRDARRRNALQQNGDVVLEFTTADVLDEQSYVVGTLVKQLPVRVLR